MPPIMGASARYLILLLRQIQLGVAQIADARSEAEAEQMHEGEDVVREAGRVGVMLLDPQVGFMVKQPIEDVGGVAHTDVDDLGAERRVLVRDVGVEEFAWFGAILGVDVAGALSFASSPEALSIRGRCGSVAPVLRERLPGLGVDEFRQRRGVRFIADVPGLQPRELCIARSGA